MRRWLLSRAVRSELQAAIRAHRPPPPPPEVVVYGPFAYSSDDQGLLYRRPAGSPSAPLQRVVPEPAHCVSVAPDNMRVACVRQGRLRVYTMADLTFEDVPTAHAKGVEWAADSSRLFYSCGDDAVRASQVWLRDRHGSATLVAEEHDSRFVLELACTKDRSHVRISRHAMDACEHWVVPAGAPASPPRLVGPSRVARTKYAVEHLPRTQQWVSWIDNAQQLLCDGRVVWTAPARSSVTDMEVFHDRVDLLGYADTVPTLFRVDVASRTLVAQQQFPEHSCITAHGNWDMSAPDTHYTLERPAPGLVRLADPDAGVPVTLVPGATPRSPVLLHVYGAYGTVCAPGDDAFLAPLLRRGWGVAYAHVRGGGMLGPAWHAAGRATQRANASADVLRVAHMLRSRNLCGALVLRAYSAGGFAAAAALNAQPGWFAGALLEVPFVHPLSDVSSTVARLESDEWGPTDTLAALDPAHNVRHCASPLPPLYLTASPNDTRVPHHQVVTYAQRVRERFPATPVTLSLVDGHVAAPHTTLDEQTQQVLFLLGLATQ